MEDYRKILEDLQSTDPTIIIKDDTIELLPCYLNSSLIFDFILLLVCIVAIFYNEILIGFIGILVSLFNIGDFLRINNKMIIDTKNKYIRVTPNFISRLFLKNYQEINLENIRNVTLSTTTFNSLIFKRFAIVITLSNSDEVKIITTANEGRAEIIANVLKGLP